MRKPVEVTRNVAPGTCRNRWSTRGSGPRNVVTVLALTGAACGGCVPSDFHSAERVLADRSRVRDAATRYVSGAPFLRFDEALLSDLDDAIDASDPSTQRRLGVEVYRAANRLDLEAAFGEIERMPDASRRELAARAGIASTTAALREHYQAISQRSLVELEQSCSTLSTDAFRRRLVDLRKNVAPALDHQGRFGRQAALAWAAIPAWLGVGAVERRLERERAARDNAPFAHAALWRPASDAAPTAGIGAELRRFAPVVAMHHEACAATTPEHDQLGEVRLSRGADHPEVSIDPGRAVVYAYTTDARLFGRRFPQRVYVWWFSEHPEMSAGDPAAGHIDGDVLRVTLNSAGRPAIIEFAQTCGCTHELFVSEATESAAAREYGPPIRGRRFAIERDTRPRRPLIVSGTFAESGAGARPIAFIDGGYHTIAALTCDEGLLRSRTHVDGERTYVLRSYDDLDRLPLGDGVASMFGPDGLVWGAGRAEGILLAPTGILSAGQPRKRGTQRIRWDEYAFDDPHLLERALRIPHDF